MQASEPKTDTATERPELPDWVTETPIEPGYQLSMWDEGDGGTALQVVSMTREEYLALKSFLAAQRGLVEPIETAAPRIQEPQPMNSAEKASASERLTGEVIDRIVDILWGEVHAYRELASGPSADHAQRLRCEVQADIFALWDILTDWESKGFSDAYPKESRLVAAIRGRLAL